MARDASVGSFNVQFRFLDARAIDVILFENVELLSRFRSRIAARPVLTGAVLVAFGVGAGLWLARKPIARNALDQALAARGVPARYRVVSIGVRWERIEDVSIGDPRNPDLTAQWIEVRIRTRLSGIGVSAVRAGGVRLKGRVVDGHVSLGAVDRLLPKSDGQTPLTLPDLDVDVSDARVHLATPLGKVDALIDGRGNLIDGFRGKVRAASPTFGTGDCKGDRVRGVFNVTIKDRSPVLQGPARLARLICRGASLSDVRVDTSASLDRSLTRWTGQSALAVSDLSYPRLRARGIGGHLKFDRTPSSTRLAGSLYADAAAAGQTTVTDLRARFALDMASNPKGTFAAKIGNVTPATSMIARMRTLDRYGRDTPVGPPLALLVDRTRAAVARGITVEAQGSVADGAITVQRATARSGSGAMLGLSGGSGLQFGLHRFLADTKVALAGGGLPRVDAEFRRREDGKSAGLIRIAPIATTSGRLGLAPVRFAATPGGAMLFETDVTSDGPLPNGRVERLQFPLSVDLGTNGGASINRGCTPVRIARLDNATLHLNRSAVRICPDRSPALITIRDGHASGRWTVARPALTGRLGDNLVSFSAQTAKIDIGTLRFGVRGAAILVGQPQKRARLAIGMLSGRAANGVAQGSFGDGAGQIAAVPIDMTGAKGRWQFRNGRLDVRGGASIADAAASPRYNRLESDDVHFTLAGKRIDATATLRNPATGTPVVRTAIVHDLNSGTGNARLSVDGLTFGKTLQPEQLTPLTLGVIANVVGRIDGDGRIDWSARGVTSSGQFSTETLDTAAAFGPVTGLKGRIVFNDLLALATPPGQELRIAAINTGIVVTDGVIRFQLLPEQRIVIERGAWPFSGGTLSLDPSVIEFAKARTRRLTFRIAALDAAKFIERFDLKDLAATGTFDGVVPMVFDERGGRIEKGHLAARKGGGTLAYVGDVSNVRMNVFANLAFDALKSIRYSNLAIDLDGALDSEIISRVTFDGVNENPLSPPKSFLARKFIGLPFRFNITIRAPFRSLLNTARTFQDPTSLIQQTLPELQKPSIQPSESDNKP